MPEYQKPNPSDTGLCEHGNFCNNCDYCSTDSARDTKEGKSVHIDNSNAEYSDIKRGDLKKYAKKEHVEDIRQRVSEAREIRHKYFDRKEPISDQLSKVREQIASNKESFDTIAKGLQEITENLNEKSSSFFSRIIEYFSINKLERGLSVKKNDKIKIEAELSNLLAIEGEFSTQLEDRKELETIKNIFKSFYDSHIDDFKQHQEKEKIAELERIKKEEMARQVETISRDYEVVFVHGISVGYSPESNSLLQTQGVGFETKVKLAISLEPTISASTLRRGISRDATWSSSGLVIGKGRVETANINDANTKAVGIYRRKNPEIESRNNIIDNIKYSVMAPEGRMGSSYNEFVVSNPRFVGMYLEDGWDESGLPLRTEDFFKTAEELNLPTYFSRDGEFFELSLNEETGEVEIGGKIDRAAIVEKVCEFNQEEKEQIFKETLEKGMPFDLERILPEAQLVSARATGIRQYMELRGAALAGKNNGIEMTFENFDAYIYPESIRADECGNSRECFVGDTVRLLKEVIFPNGKIIRYFENDGKIYKQEREDYKKKHAIYNESFMLVSADEKYTDSIRFSDWEGYNLKYKLGIILSNSPTPDEYMGVISIVIEKIEKEIKENINFPKNNQKLLEAINFYLYGIAETAGQFGDTETQKKSLELTKKLKNEEKYREIVNRRLDDKGRFKFTKKDLE